MHPKHKRPRTAKASTPITINANGEAVPRSAGISIAGNGGATINASYPCTLIFTVPPDCPFANGVGNKLSLDQGPNDEPLKDPVTEQKYTFKIQPARKPGTKGHKPFDDQFDVIVSS